MVTFIINGTRQQLGAVLPPQISTLSIEYPPVHIQVPKAQLAQIEDWLRQLVANCTADYIWINGTYIKTSDLKDS